MGLECGWCFAQKRWAENLEDLKKNKKHGSWVPTIVLKSWVPTMVLRSWGPTVMLRSWGPTMVLRIWDWTTRYAKCWGVVSIVWYERLLRIVSLFVSKKWSLKLMNAFVPEQRNRLCIWVRLYLYYGYITPLDMTLYHLMVKLQFWSFGESGVLLQSHCSQVHSGRE